MNPYDGKTFFITNPDPARPGLGFLGPSDGSFPARPIMGCEHGGRYDLGDGGALGTSTFGPWLAGDGQIEHAVPGPWVGPEIDEYLGKKGQQATPHFPNVSPWPGWTVADYEAPLLDAVVGGPNPGPDKAPEYKQVGDQIVPVGQAPAPQPVADAPAGDAKGSVPVSITQVTPGVLVATVPGEHVHESLIQALESHAVGWGHAAEADIKALLAKLRDVFNAEKAKL